MTEKTLTAGQSVSGEENARRRLFNKNKWLFSVGGIGRDIVYQLIASFLMVYIQFGVPLSLTQFTTLSLIIGVGGRVWDAVNDPMMGAIIEGTHMKWGKFKPWILIGALTCGLAIIVMFNIQNLAGWDFVVFMCVMYLIWESTFTMNDIGYWAMLPSLSSVKKERNNVTMLTVLFAGIGAFIAQGLIPMFTTGNVRAAYSGVSIIAAAAFIGCQLMTSIGVKEPINYSAEKNEKISLKKMWQTIVKNDQILWITLSMLFYNVGSMMLVTFAANLLYMEIGYNGFLYTVLVASYGVPSIFINIIYPTLANKWGRKKLQIVSISIAVAGYIGIALLGWAGGMNIILLAVFAAVISMGQSIFYTSSIINMTNCVEYNDYKQGERNEAVVSTLRPFMAKFAGALEILIVTAVLAVSGIYGLSQSISTLEAQKGYFDRMESAAQVEYIGNMNELIDEFVPQLEAAELQGKEELAKTVEQLNAKIENAEESSSYYYYKNFKINAEYIEALRDAEILLTAYGTDGKALTPEAVSVGRLGEIGYSSPEEIASANGLDPQDIDKYSFAMELGGEDSAANRNFKDKSDTSMRIWLRAAVCGIPIVCLLIALFVQRKKFIIDEEYYDNMVKEIEKRNKEQQN